MVRAGRRRHGTERAPRVGRRIAVAALVLQFGVLVLPRDATILPLIYASPALTALALIGVGGFRLDLRVASAWLAIAATSIVLAASTASSVLNVVLAFATYGSWLLLLPTPDTVDLVRLRRFWMRASLAIAVLLAAVGFAQLLQAGFPLRLPYRDFTPDVVRGPYGGGGPRIFTMMIAPALTILIATSVMRRFRVLREGVLIGVLGFALIAPGSNATVVAYLAALAGFSATWLLRRGALIVTDRTISRSLVGRSRRGIAVGLTAFAVLAGAFLVVGSSSAIARGLGRFAPSEEGSVSPKLQVARDTLTVLPERAPYQPLVGVGLGNYSSWAQLLLSGAYPERFLSGRVTSLPVSVRDDANDIVFWHISPEAYDRFGRWYVESIATQPWWSWQSLWAEIGLIGLFLVGIAVVPRLRRLRIVRTDAPELRVVKVVAGILVWFVVILGFVDDYFEYPWLIVPALLALLLLPKAGATPSRSDG